MAKKTRSKSIRGVSLSDHFIVKLDACKTLSQGMALLNSELDLQSEAERFPTRNSSILFQGESSSLPISKLVKTKAGTHHQNSRQNINQPFRKRNVRSWLVEDDVCRKMEHLYIWNFPKPELLYGNLEIFKSGTTGQKVLAR